jgi:hypothetical protein
MLKAKTKTPAEVSRVTLRLPPFWAEGPAFAKDQFSLAGITAEKTKFYCYLFQLDHRYAMEVQNIVISPPQRDPYTNLKTDMLNSLSHSRQRRAHQLLTCEELGYRKPSQFPRQLRNVASDVPDYLLHIFWSSRLRSNVEVALSDIPEIELDTAVPCADRIIEAVFPSTLPSIPSPTDNTEFQRKYRIGSWNESTSHCN